MKKKPSSTKSSRRGHLKPALVKVVTVGVGLLMVFSLVSFFWQSATPAAAPSANRVIIEGFAFKPNTLTVPAGTIVTWHNKDSTTHTVTERNNTFVSSHLTRDSSFSFTFTQKGTFEYYCSSHPNMTGKVIVR